VLKTHNCGELRKEDTGKTVTLSGWVHRRRDLGNLIFIDLRDREGLMQIVFNPEFSYDAHNLANSLRNEYVIQVTGDVSIRPEGTVNSRLPTGEIEVHATLLKIFNAAKTPPFYINEDVDVDENLCLKSQAVLNAAEHYSAA